MIQSGINFEAGQTRTKRDPIDVTRLQRWYILMVLLFVIAIFFSSFPADAIDSSNDDHHHLPIVCSVWMKDHLVITGTPRMHVVSSNILKPPPTAICPHTTAKLLVQYILLDNQWFLLMWQMQVVYHNQNDSSASKPSPCGVFPPQL